ncbi:hypothetical protein QQX98_004873 [Neonectria punicea]|uniref:SprT-like domain-containing protein n=1 Tax=Neonectria punicea TaxID=979145 RepID=A0ABR1H7M8_9HYPO
MARLADFCPSSDDELPDLKTLLRKPSTRVTRGTSTAPKTEAKSLAPKSTSKSRTRRVRRLGEPSQSAPNPLFQKWSSEEPGNSQGSVEATAKEPRRRVKQVLERKPSKSPSSDADSEDDEPQTRVRRSPVIEDLDDEPPVRVQRRPPVVEDSEDETDKASGSDQEALLTRIRRLQRTRGGTVTKPKVEAKPQSSRTPMEEKPRSKASEIAKAWDSESETETVRDYVEAEVDDPSIYQTAEEESSGLSSDSEIDDSPFRPQRRPAAKSAGQGRKPSGTKDPASVINNSHLPEPTPVGQRKISAGTKKGNVLSVQENAPTKTIAQPRKPSSKYKKLEHPKPPASNSSAADLADTFAKLRLQLQDFSDDECKPSKTNEFTTPPSTPPRTSKTKGLKSPSKQTQIPQTPHRPSMDDFWSQDLVNDWNDQHSRRKLMLPPVIKSPAKQSPKKAPRIETKKAFGARKQALAEEFLSELDKEITYGRIAELAESTGGVKLVWSKTLNTTAGRANWRRETIRARQADGTQVSVQFKHHASIELAEKVIDDEDRLLNVLAHEFCHLANFMVSGVTNNPHGKEFKVWAAQCSRAFGSRGIKVTTKHSYEIDFKYVWECEECATEFKRHSKSIDPQRHRCGSCKGLLRQTKPVPRAAGKTTSRYLEFVKEQMAVVREENPGSPQKDVMKLIAVKWAKQGTSSKTGKESKAGGDNVVEKMVDLTLEEEV